MRQISCDYCGQPTLYTDSAVIYGRSYGMIYYCPDCMAWVGVHRGTDNPKGRLANAVLRELKKAAHAAFDPLWMKGRMKRDEAYTWLADRMGLSYNNAHIGLFDAAQCRQVIQICNERSAIYDGGYE